MATELAFVMWVGVARLAILKYVKTIVGLMEFVITKYVNARRVGPERYVKYFFKNYSFIYLLTHLEFPIFLKNYDLDL